MLFDSLSVVCATWRGLSFMMRDFNLIRCMAEAFGGNPRLPEMIEFDEFLNRIDLIELRVKEVCLCGLVNRQTL